MSIARQFPAFPRPNSDRRGEYVAKLVSYNAEAAYGEVQIRPEQQAISLPVSGTGYVVGEYVRIERTDGRLRRIYARAPQVTDADVGVGDVVPDSTVGTFTTSVRPVFTGSWWKLRSQWRYPDPLDGTDRVYQYGHGVFSYRGFIGFGEQIVALAPIEITEAYLDFEVTYGMMGDDPRYGVFYGYTSTDGVQPSGIPNLYGDVFSTSGIVGSRTTLLLPEQARADFASGAAKGIVFDSDTPSTYAYMNGYTVDPRLSLVITYRKYI